MNYEKTTLSDDLSLFYQFLFLKKKNKIKKYISKILQLSCFSDMSAKERNMRMQGNGWKAYVVSYHAIKKGKEPLS